MEKKFLMLSVWRKWREAGIYFTMKGFIICKLHLIFLG
jgi:hypothetical protein